MLALGQWEAGSLDTQQFLSFFKCCPKERDSNCDKVAKRIQTRLNQLQLAISTNNVISESSCSL